jgi:hypothetical protein
MENSKSFKDRLVSFLGQALLVVIATLLVIGGLIIFPFSKRFRKVKDFKEFKYDETYWCINLWDKYKFPIIKTYDAGTIRREDDIFFRKSKTMSPEFQGTTATTFTIFGSERILLRVYYRRCAYSFCKGDCKYCEKLYYMLDKVNEKKGT